MATHMRRIQRTTIALATIATVSLWITLGYQLYQTISTPYSPILAPIYHAPRIPASAPVYLTIEKLNIVSAPVQPVGLDANGLMEVPKTADSVVWYKPGATPGASGNAVIAGHFDWVDGPAVFYHLQELTQGDTITVTDTNNQSWQFTVTHTVSYPSGDIPLSEVFGESSDIRLNLITCDGTLDSTTKTYQNRVVVYTTRQ